MSEPLDETMERIILLVANKGWPDLNWDEQNAFIAKIRRWVQSYGEQCAWKSILCTSCKHEFEPEE